MTRYGGAAWGWKIDGDRWRVTVRVPASASATVYLPAAKLQDVREGNSPLASRAGVTRATQVGDTVVVEVGSGSYIFAYKAPSSTPT